jgi:predicted amidohydrolase YtcJ
MEFPLSSMETVFHKDRWRDAYLWKTLKDHGAAIAYASDWPVTDISVMRGIQAQMTRVPFEGAGDERLSLMETLYAYTAGGAWAAHMEGVCGRLVPGLAADLVLLDRDIEAVSPTDLGRMGIALTVAGGQITHRGTGFA